MIDTSTISVNALNVVAHTCYVQIMLASNCVGAKGVGEKMNKLRKGVILVELEKAMAGEMNIRLEWQLRGKSPKLSVRDSKIIRLICHDISPELGHYAQTEVAEILDIPPSTVSFRVAWLKKHLPWLIILTPFEAKCTDQHLKHGRTTTEIAERLDISESAVKKAFRRARDKGLLWCKGLGRMLSYDAYATFDDEKGIGNWLDDKVKMKF